MKLYVALILYVFLTTILMAQTAIAPAAGDGTEGNPYEIANLENLYWIAADNDVVPNPDQVERWSSHYIQTADIDASETVNWFNGEGWSPIGIFFWDDYYPVYVPYTGSYNGQGYIINDLYINRSNSDSIGLFGYVQDASIENLGVTNVDIMGSSNVGGLVGYLSYSVISNCHSNGYVNGNISVGGLIGSLFSTTISNCYATGSVVGETLVGGLLGFQNHSAVNSCFFIGSVNGTNAVGGLLGRQRNSIIHNSYYNFEEVLINNESVITIGALDSTTYNAWYNNNFNLNIDDYLSYDGEDYLINSIEDFKQLLAFGQQEQYTFRLTVDLDLQNHPNFYIPYFSGSFDGDGHVIDNLSINMSSYSFIGLFGYASGALIENLGVTNIDIVGFFNIGGLVGCQWSNSTVNNCYSTGNLSGSTTIGGLMGYQDNSTVNNSYSMVNVSGGDYVGGLLAAQGNYSIINNSFNTGVVSGGQQVGGLVSEQGGNSSVYYSYNTGNVSGNASVGGLVGSQIESIISNSYNTGNVNAIYEIAGGLAGSQLYNSSINNCYNLGSVSGSYTVGGLVGIHGDASINNSYSSGTVTGQNNVGGLVGYQNETIVNNSYWNTETSGQTTSAGGDGRTTEEMTYPYETNTYVDWDFQEIWAADFDYLVNDGYPYLREPIVTVEEEIFAITEQLKIYNYPNPFNPETTIRFYLPEEVEILELRIYNIRGQLVRTLIEGTPHQKGDFEVVWDGKNDLGKPVTSGVYFYRLTTPDYDKTNKMLLLK